MLVNSEPITITSIPRRLRISGYTPPKYLEEKFYQPSRWLSTWCQASKYLDCIQNIFNKAFFSLSYGCFGLKKTVRGFYVERCYLSNFTGSFVYFGAAYRHRRMVMHATWIISIFRKPLIMFHLMGCLNPRQQGCLIEPWEKEKLAREQNKKFRIRQNGK